MTTKAVAVVCRAFCSFYRELVLGKSIYGVSAFLSQHVSMTAGKYARRGNCEMIATPRTRTAADDGVTALGVCMRR